jgi:hypothetical protein
MYNEVRKGDLISHTPVEGQQVPPPHEYHHHCGRSDDGSGSSVHDIGNQKDYAAHPYGKQNRTRYQKAIAYLQPCSSLPLTPQDAMLDGRRYEEGGCQRRRQQRRKVDASLKRSGFSEAIHEGHCKQEGEGHLHPWQDHSKLL